MKYRQMPYLPPIQRCPASGMTGSARLLPILREMISAPPHNLHRKPECIQQEIQHAEAEGSYR